MSFTLHQLRNFVAVAEAGSVSRAAQAPSASARKRPVTTSGSRAPPA
ncbi:hypothetical protein Rumeso_03405 [Rubellimicrobium mesophilum DSM 19309]|uniref:HTH lysR-type domain-containing protein n=1 Tax=Rubellimicrobium mesophilum DSM 19309 TaxID=442562 RepID=A0A017HKT5_9RHOB|nr:LysR family transcriptional regulator [Rubellimicrobium mesophilum]EYD75077.1 hypothetical protein Rumeso_03405 [Rubellimicrobium mesophilum DSM 19309]